MKNYKPIIIIRGKPTAIENVVVNPIVIKVI